MPRSQLKKKRILLPDPIYNSISVHMLVNRVLKSGKKSIAYKIIYTAFKEIGEVTNLNPVLVFEEALKNLTPSVEVKPRRRGGAIQMVPRILRQKDKALAKTLQWVLESCYKKSGQTMSTKLKNEIIDAYKKTGSSLKKKEELYKIALSNAMYASNPQKILNALNMEKA
jgi:small subunit ribosomal protein S7